MIITTRLSLLALLVLLPLASGCGPTPPASFRLNMVEAISPSAEKDSISAEQALTPAQEKQVATILAAMFGTPDTPTCLPETGLDPAKLVLAAGPVRSDIVGRKNGLYREHCVHCHGITGDGMGPTAAFLNPYPRDYRPGVFKFKSTERASKPTHADLYRVLHEGLAGSSMPSFALLSPVQIDALVEYVKYLSMRGETELALMRYYFELDEEDEGKLPETREFLVEEILEPIAEKWASAEDQEIEVPEMPEDLDLAASIAKGRELFHGDKANCVKCHGVTALGDGQANDYDDWSKNIYKIEEKLKTLADSEPDSEERQWIAEFERVLAGDALTPRTIPPRNLRQGIYRGGRRPLDLYYRIHAGINGAPMPAAKGTVAPEDIWHIVNYIRSLPYDFDGELGADRAVAAQPGPAGRLVATQED
ncbi:MAG: cytochrome c [Planctomycetota bacterium]|jgi:mono/diheme cytochrome c family protein|nr:c-type cytochrome [Pirellulales bacterium]MDA0253468.1 cytochrome c [Planctomycetota bacterium]MDA1200189.1 cytochrome c [Planctomycetota bacterium]